MTKRDKNLILRMLFGFSLVLCVLGYFSFMEEFVIGCILGAFNGIVNKPQ